MGARVAKSKERILIAINEHGVKDENCSNV